MEELSEAHQMAFKSIAKVVEKKLIEMQASLLKYKAYSPVHIELVDDLEENKKMIILDQIDKLRMLLKEFGIKYGIGVENHSLKNEINIKATFLWEDLCGSLDHIDGYGPIDETVKKDFIQYMQQMIALVNAIIKDSN